MRIAINGLSARFGGGLAYLRNLLEHLSRIDHENTYVVFSSPEKRDSFTVDAPNFSVIVPGFPGKAIVRRAIWEQIVLPAFIRRHSIDLLFSPGGIAPIFLPGGCKRVNMVQNMAPFSDELLRSYPINKRKLRFLILRKLYPFFAARSDANIFISRDGLEILQSFMRLESGKSKVIYHGRNKLFKPVLTEMAADFVRTQYGIDGNFILYVSNVARYKKQLEVVKAYHILRSRIAETGKSVRLVLAGIMVEPSYYREVLALADRLGIKEEVAYLGQVPQDHLPYLYSAASVFVFASISENCPNVLIEAMACGAPIVSSNPGPMPEICGDAALYFDPTDPADVADKMWRVLTDEQIRQNLIRNALENVKRFSWEETARRTLEVFRELARHNHSIEV
jgi:glycosyltransferase involved in cell wall biosynthesis